MYHLGSGIQILSAAREGNAGEFAVGMITLQNGCRIQIGNMGAKRAGNPFHPSALLHQCTLGVEVVHVLRPVLNRGIAKPCILLDIQLHTARMKIGNIVFWCRAAFNEMKIRPFIYDNQRMLKLSCSLCVQSEIGLKRNLHLHALRHINKGSAGPHRSMQCCEFVIGRRYQMHEVLFHHVLILTGHCLFKARIDYALLRHIILQIMIYQFRVILRADARKRLTLSLRNSELLKGILDLVRDLTPVALHIRMRPDIRRNPFHVQSLNGRTPVRNLQLIVQVKTLQPELPHPFRVMLLFGDSLHNIRSQAFLHTIESFRFIILKIVQASIDLFELLFCHSCLSMPQSVCGIGTVVLYCAPANLSNPRSLISSTNSAPPVCTRFPFTSTCV